MFKNIASPTKIIFALALVFLGAQAFTGDQGLLQWREYKIKSDALENNKKILEERRVDLEKKIARLSTNSADSDYVTELALGRLDMANPKAIVIKTDN